MNKKLILLVEDNQDTADLIIRVLRRNNIEADIVVVRDGVEALAHLFGGGTSLPHVVLLDLKLPKLNGLEVLRRLRTDERTRFLPVVLLSSSCEESEILESYRRGANSYVCKPVNFNEFSEAIKQLGFYWLFINHPVTEK